MKNVSAYDSFHPMKPFNHLNLNNEMLDNLKKLNYEIMTPIQEKTIPLILKRVDLLAQAKTGSGKTAAFGIGLLHNLNVRRFRIQALVLCPTRELAEQVTGELRRIARFKHNIKLLKITGGAPMYKQEHSLKHQAHIVIGTPGRIQKLLNRGSLVLDEVKTVVLDEADRMLDMGFIDQINYIMGFAPENRQTLCFSATFPGEIKELSRRIQNNPQEVVVETQHDSMVIQHQFFSLQKDKKAAAVLNLIDKRRPESILIFCNTKDGCRSVVKKLKEYGLGALAINGDLEQKERTEVLIRFSNGSSRILVATDVAARGLDISDLGAVINWDLPLDTECYIHRIGRTGRAGRKGFAFSFVSPKEQFRLDLINDYMKSSYFIEKLDIKSDDEINGWESGMVSLSINAGRRNKVAAGDILGALTSTGELRGDDIGRIDRLDYITFIAVKRSAAEAAYKLLETGMIKGRRYRVKKHM